MKIIKRLGIFLFFFMFMVKVDANSINSIDMDIKVDNNGNAHVTEIWNTDLDQGTEIFKPYYNLGNSKIKNLEVALNNRKFTNDSNWNIDGSFKDKAYKSGINQTKDRVELCFGISKFGSNIYTLSYDITNFVSETDDSQIIYWTLMPHKITPTPAKVYIKISSDFKYSDNLDVWGYGNYGGEAYVYNGYIELKSPKDYSTGDYMTVLVKFPLKTFNASNKIGNDFNYYYNMAQKGTSSYESDSSSDSSFLFFLVFIVIAIILSVVFKIIPLNTPRDRFQFKGGNKVNKDVPYIRDIIFNKDVFKAYWIAKNYNLMKKDTDFFGVMLLKWLHEKKIEILKTTGEGLFKKKEETSIKFHKDMSFDDSLEASLYRMMYEASVDGILSKNEFKRWAKDNYKKIFDWLEAVINNYTDHLMFENLIVAKEIKVFKIFKCKGMEVSYKVMKDAEELYGLKKFLQDFSRIHEKEPIEVGLWEYYLIFAQLFGIAKQVAKDFKDIYPDVITEDIYDDITYINYFSYHAIMDVVGAKSEAESYSAGGGGFSSGGGGGGSFGGGGGGGGVR